MNTCPARFVFERGVGEKARLRHQGYPAVIRNSDGNDGNDGHWPSL